jgi:DNA-binding cell septation regulator SpoVG
MVREITVNLNLTRKPGNIAAVGDVTLDLADAGSIEMSGYRVMQSDGKPPWVSMPARKSDKGHWFDTVKLRGPVKKAVETALLQEYAHLIRNGSKPDDTA